MRDVEKTSITRLVLQGFRNHDELELQPGNSITIVVGPNAAGKTSVLEAISLVTRASSFRSFNWEDVVKRGAERAVVKLGAVRGLIPIDLGLVVEASGTRAHRVGGVRKRKMSEILGKVPVVTFIPDDLQLAKGPADTRRAAVDLLGSQMSAAYATLRSEYHKTVRQRNALLKKDHSRIELGVWNERLVQTGSAFFVHRTRLISRLSTRIVKAYERLAPGEHIEVALKCSWSDEPSPVDRCQAMTKEDISSLMAEEVRRREREEKERGVTLVGPHRDDLLLTVNGLPSRTFASQGQQRSLALAWKMAEVAVVGDVGGYQPVLLLDDVMSELDEARREKLQEFVKGGMQTLFTTTNITYFHDSILSNAHVVEVGQ